MTALTIQVVPRRSGLSEPTLRVGIEDTRTDQANRGRGRAAVVLR